MDTTLYVTLYPHPRTLVNGILLGIKHDRLDLRLSHELGHLDTVYATVWLEPVPINCHLRIIESSEDPVTGELRALAKPIDLNLAEQMALRGATARETYTTRFVNVSRA
jgi:hypothetical protein